jgi:hypothetical protein
MTLREPSRLFDDVLDLLSSTPTPEQIIEFQPSAPLRARVSELLERQRDIGLTAEEQAELDEFAQLNHFMSMLRARARKRLADNE